MFESGDKVQIYAPASRKYNGATGEVVGESRRAGWFRIKLEADPDKVLAVNGLCLERLDDESGPQGNVIAGCLK